MHTFNLLTGVAALAITVSAIPQSLDTGILTQLPSASVLPQVPSASLVTSIPSGCPLSGSAFDTYETCVNAKVSSAYGDSLMPQSGALCDAYSGIWTCFSAYCPNAATRANYLTTGCSNPPALMTGSLSGVSVDSGSSTSNGGSGAQQTSGIAQEQTGVAPRIANDVVMGTMGMVAAGVGLLAVIL